MARNTSITIGDHFSHFVSEQVRSGRYGSISDVVRAGLRLLEEHEARLRALGGGSSLDASAGGAISPDRQVLGESIEQAMPVNR